MTTMKERIAACEATILGKTNPQFSAEAVEFKKTWKTFIPQRPDDPKDYYDEQSDEENPHEGDNEDYSSSSDDNISS
jgi:hypothetical protein